MGLALLKDQIKIQPKTVVAGLGETGKSVARFLSAQGIAFSMVDTRDEPSGLNEFSKEFNEIEIFLTGKYRVHDVRKKKFPDWMVNLMNSIRTVHSKAQEKRS